MYAMVMVHWNGDIDTTALDFYVTFVDIPLCIWYLSFYCSPKTKFVVISKILEMAFNNTVNVWSNYIEMYIYAGLPLELWIH